MKNIFVHFIFILTLIMNASCVHTSSHENKTVVLSQSDAGMNTVQIHQLELSSFVYSQSKWPLEDFFKNMTRGQIKTAFKKFDLKYQSANHHNDIINELLDDGFVPVYVQIKNIGSQPIQLNEKMFALNSDDQNYQPLMNDQIPRAFDRFNQKALAANIYNVTAVTAGIVGYFVLVCVLTMASNNRLDFSKQSAGSSNFGAQSGNEEILNSLNKKIHLDYKDYILNELTLQPNEKVEKLLFFKTKNTNEKTTLVFNGF